MSNTCFRLTPVLIALGLGAAAAMPAHADLIISEYVEGSSNNKALEFYNNGSQAIDLAAEGYAVKMYFNGNTSAGNTINLSGSVAPGATFVLAHGSADPAILAKAQQTNSGSWYNGDDAVALTKAGVAVDVIGQIGVDPGSAWGSGDVQTMDRSLRRKANITVGDANGSDAFDPSVEWDGFPINTFDGLGSHNGQGTGGGGDPQDPPPAGEPGSVTIAQIQGAGHVSPLKGQTVNNVPGIVSVVTSSGFYMQDPVGDGNPATSEGIFVYTGSAPSVTSGTQVLVSGKVTEYRRGNVATNLTITEIGGTVTVTPTSGLFGGAVLHPVLLGLGGRPFPTDVVDNDTNGSLENPAQTQFDPAEDGIDFLESLEGMWVQVNDAQAVSPTNKYGEIYIVADAGAAATHMNSRGGITLTAEDKNPERLQMDDTLMGATAPQVTVGTRFGTLTGVIDYDYGSYEFLPSAPVTPLAHELPRAVAQIPAGANDLSVASFNVENLDPKVEDRSKVSSASDVDDDVGTGKFAAIADYIVHRAASPDIVALQEVQDNNGAENDGVVAADQTLNLLVQNIADAGGPTYAWAQIDPVNLAEGGQPGGNIRVAFLYNPARVSLAPSQHGIGGSTTATAVVDGAQGPSLSYNPGRINPTSEAWSDSRVPLVAQFRFNGQDVFIVNDHFASKGGSTPEFGVQQPMVNGGVDHRTAQATEVNGFVNSLLAADAHAKVLVLGDLNEFGWNVPLKTLRGEMPGQTKVLTDLADLLLPESERYSYVFEGNSQELDHMLVSDGLKNVARFEVLHVNSEFPDQISDHDPARAVFTLAPAARAGDLNGDGQLTMVDAGLLRASVGSCQGEARYLSGADLDQSGCVDRLDIAAWMRLYNQR